LNNKSLSYLAEAVDKTKRGIHIHTAEDIYDWINSKELFGKNILERLEDFNLVSSKSIFVHGVFLEEKDIKIINAFDSFLIHNPRSNMNNSVGYFSKLQDIKNIAVGTDGIGSNMFEETKIAYFKSQDAKTNTAMGDFLKFLQNGNILLERYFNQKFGCIQEGYKADLVIFDYNSPTPLNEQNLTGHFIFGMSSRDVETVIINGKIVYEERQFPFDIRDIYTQSQSAAKKMWERMDKILD
jgi:cytosine/adenosine deaminase-related metal-dependent hydrolase